MPLGGSRVVVALDSGTSSTKAIAIDAEGLVIARGSVPIGLATPQPGWVEQDAHEIAASASIALEDLTAKLRGATVVALGISNQRESLLIWDRATGRAISPVLSWQDRRTASISERLASAGHGSDVRRISGLPLDPMFSAVKATWLLDKYDPDRLRSTAGEICLGTVDSWLAWNLTGAHVTEPGNASRTSLLDVNSAAWSPQLLDIFGVPVQCLPTIGPSAREDLVVSSGPLQGIPLAGIVGDSHAALFAHCGWLTGTAKATLGTGSSVMATVAATVDSTGLCRTIAWQLPNEAPTLALEGNILAAGAALTWLANLFNTTPDALAAEAVDHTGVALVPAFDGLGAPWWDARAVATITGLSFSSTRADLARAALDAVVMQIVDVTRAFDECGAPLASLVVDGGMTANGRLMQDLADATEMPIHVSEVPEASAVGAANMAGIGVGLWTAGDLEGRSRPYRTIRSVGDEAARKHRASVWADGLRRARAVPTNGEDHV